MKSVVYHDGKETDWHQLVESINEAAVVIINKLERIPWQHSVLRRLAACILHGAGHFKRVL